jgi:hypothetical protein
MTMSRINGLSPSLHPSGENGVWTLTAAVYDLESSKLSDYTAGEIIVPDISVVAPVVGGILPNQGYHKAAIVITGTNFIPGDTA